MLNMTQEPISQIEHPAVPWRLHESALLSMQNKLMDERAHTSHYMNLYETTRDQLYIARADLALCRDQLLKRSSTLDRLKRSVTRWITTRMSR